jgi:hypothetical protein
MTETLGALMLDQILAFLRISGSKRLPNWAVAERLKGSLLIWIEPRKRSEARKELQ